MKAKKFIEKKIEGEYEVIKNHVVEIKINEQMVEKVSFEFLGAGDDPEWDYTNYGILTDSDGELSYIKIGTFLDAVDERNQENARIDEEELESSLYDEIQKLKPYRDYEIYC